MDELLKHLLLLTSAGILNLKNESQIVCYGMKN